MLVLSRKPGQRILIGADTVLTVCRVAGNRVRIGIEAPANVRIMRDEIDEQDDDDEFDLGDPVGRV